jgi:hypothetical protein
MCAPNAAVPIQEYSKTLAGQEFKLAMNPNEPGKSYWDTGFKIALSYNAGNTARRTVCQMMQAELAALNPLMLIEIPRSARINSSYDISQGVQIREDRCCSCACNRESRAVISAPLSPRSSRDRSMIAEGIPNREAMSMA